MMLRSLVAGAALLLAAGGVATAQSPSDPVPPTGAGGVLPVEDILAPVRQAVDGVITDIELDAEGGDWAYDVDVVSPQGEKTEVKVDARSGKVLSKKVKRK